MPIDNRVPRRLSIVLLAIIVLLPLPASPGAPEGHPDSIEPRLRSELNLAMDRYAQFQDSSFSIKIKAFMWDHRQEVAIREVSDARLIDATLCILWRGYGYEGFKDYTLSKSFVRWCYALKPNAY